MFDDLLEILINEAKKEREQVHVYNSSLDEKRAVATVVTKLEEAKMWHRYFIELNGEDEKND